MVCLTMAPLLAGGARSGSRPADQRQMSSRHSFTTRRRPRAPSPRASSSSRASGKRRSDDAAVPCLFTSLSTEVACCSESTTRALSSERRLGYRLACPVGISCIVCTPSIQSHEHLSGSHGREKALWMPQPPPAYRPYEQATLSLRYWWHLRDIKLCVRRFMHYFRTHRPSTASHALCAPFSICPAYNMPTRSVTVRSAHRQ